MVFVLSNFDLFLQLLMQAFESLESKSLLDENNLDAAGVEGVAGPKDFIVNKGRGGDAVGITGTSRLGREGKLGGTSKGLLLILDDLVGTSKDNDVGSAKGDTTDLGAGEIAVGELTVLGNGSDGGQVVVDGGSDGAAELGLLGGVRLGEDGGVDVVPGTNVEQKRGEGRGREWESAACERRRGRRR